MSGRIARRRFVSIARAARAAVGTLVLVGSAHAQTTTWQATTDNWFTATNWSAGLPTSNDTADISNGGEAQIAASGAAVSTLQLGTGTGQQGSIALSTGGGLTASTEQIGVAGSGTVTQSDGTNVAGEIDLGYQSGGSGNYQLTSGTLAGGTSGSGYLYVGRLGSGTFTQSGGTQSMSVSIGEDGASGQYNLQGGSLTGNSIDVGAGGGFTQTGGTLSVVGFEQEGGTVSLPALTVGGQQGAGYYSLNGGTLSSPTITVAGGGFSVLSGQLSCSTLNIASGSASFPGAVLDSGSPQLQIPTPTGVAAPTVNITGGSISVDNEYLGYTSGTFSYTQPSAGPTFSSTSLYVGWASGSNASYNLSSSLSLTRLDVGYMGTGSFNQSGGTTSLANDLDLGTVSGASGSYTLSAGTLNAPTEIIGDGGTGQFTQNGGTNNGFIYLANGSYYLNGGALNATTVRYGATSTFVKTGGTFTFGTFIQTGGKITGGATGSPLPGTLVLGTGGIGTEYSLVLGALDCPTITINSGGTFDFEGGVVGSNTVNLTGGTLVVPTITLDSGSPAISIPVAVGQPQPTLNLSSGTVDGNAIYLGATAGANVSYTQSLPYALGGQLLIAQAPNSTATYTLPSGQTLNADEAIGYGGTGQFIQTGGSNAGNISITNGSYLQSGGTCSATITITNGSFTQSGGSNTGTQFIEVGVGSGTANFSLSGGSISGSLQEDVGETNSGTFTQTGGTNAPGLLQVGSGSVAGTYLLTGGTLAISGGLEINNGSMTIAGDSATCNILSNAGKLVLAGASSGAVAGELSDAHGYTQTGELDIGIGGDGAGSDGLLSVEGDASLGGALVVDLTNGFVPEPGESFEILTASSISGAFSSVTLPPDMDLSYSSTGVFVTAVPEPGSVMASVAGCMAMRLNRRRRRA